MQNFSYTDAVLALTHNQHLLMKNWMIDEYRESRVRKYLKRWKQFLGVGKSKRNACRQGTGFREF